MSLFILKVYRQKKIVIHNYEQSIITYQVQQFFS